MQHLSADSLIAELRAIELWDCFYTLSNSRDTAEESAWERRRERQVEILEQLIAQRMLELATRNRA